MRKTRENDIAKIVLYFARAHYGETIDEGYCYAVHHTAGDISYSSAMCPLSCQSYSEAADWLEERFPGVPVVEGEDDIA